MEFKINFEKLKEKIKTHLIVELNVFDKSLLRYLFIETHPKYREMMGQPYINVPYYSVDKKQNSVTPLIMKKDRPKLSMLNDSPFWKVDLYYGSIDKEKESELDVAFDFCFHTEKLFNKRIKGRESGEFFNSLNKLSLLENKEKYFVYVFDLPIKKYYDNQLFNNSNIALFNILEGEPENKIEISSKDLDFAIPYYFAYENEFYQKAFSCFHSIRFSEFKYDIEILYSDTIIDGREKKYYLLIGKVK